MTMPKREKIIEKAKELYAQQCYKNGIPEITPEDNELLENGFYAQAKSELMRDNQRAYVESEYVDFPSEFSVDVLEAMRSGVYISGTTGTGKSDIGMYIADQLMKKGIIVITFDGSQDWQNRSNIPEYQNPLDNPIRLIPTKSIIYDLSVLSVRSQQQTIEDFCQKIMRYVAENNNHDKYFLVFEEAQTYFPEGCMRAKRYQNTVRMMTQGRNYGIRFACITQFASLIDKNAMRYMKQRYIGYTDEPNDVEYVKRFFPKKNREDLEVTLGTLRNGEFIYKNGDKTERIQIEPYKSKTKPQQIIPSKIDPPKIPQKQNGSAIVCLIIALLFLIAIIVGFGTRPSG